jgi:hypothetical protein
MFANNANTSYNLSKLKKNLASVSTNLKQIYFIADLQLFQYNNNNSFAFRKFHF